MALKTPEQYIQSLRDGRQVYVDGRKIGDVTEDPRFRRAVDHLALAYEMAQDTNWSAKCVTTCAETGETITGCYKVPKSTEDLMFRRDTIYWASRYAGGYIPFGSTKEIGTDAIFALRMICPKIDRKYGTSYAERIKDFHHYCQQNDLALAGAVTDPKGDRSLRPYQQPNDTTYMKIVERREDGIVVKGAKAHITSAPLVNELLVLPTRAMGPEDNDYAVAFAIPANAEGIKMIANADYGSEDPVEAPLSVVRPIIHALVVFDNVFIPNDRIFLCGEWDYAGELAVTFAAWHRFTGLAYKGPVAELMLGSAVLIADYNGVAKASHIRDKIREIVMYIESIRTYSKMACYECKINDGIAMPGVLACNIGKYLFAVNYHIMLRNVQEIAGGIAGTCPSIADYRNPELTEYIDYYIVGRKEIPTENRIRVLKLIRDLTSSGEGGVHMFGTVHGEGTLEAQRMMMLREFDIQPSIDLVKSVSGVSS